MFGRELHRRYVQYPCPPSRHLSLDLRTDPVRPCSSCPEVPEDTQGLPATGKLSFSPSPLLLISDPVQPTKKDMANLHGLTELVELEIFILRISPPSDDPDMADLRIEILQASKCHKDCKCKYECGCTETGDCQKCNPPKRFLRVKWLHSSTRYGLHEVIINEGSLLREVEVSPLRILSDTTKRL